MTFTRFIKELFGWLLCAKGAENTGKIATVLTINDGWHGQDNTIAVVDDGVHWLVFNYMKIMLQVVVCL